MKKKPSTDKDSLQPEYDFASMSGGVRGKYVKRIKKGSAFILLEPDVAQSFQTGSQVNQALRMLIEVAKKQPVKKSST